MIVAIVARIAVPVWVETDAVEAKVWEILEESGWDVQEVFAEHPLPDHHAVQEAKDLYRAATQRRLTEKGQTTSGTH